MLVKQQVQFWKSQSTHLSRGPVLVPNLSSSLLFMCLYSPVYLLLFYYTGWGSNFGSVLVQQPMQWGSDLCCAIWVLPFQPKRTSSFCTEFHYYSCGFGVQTFLIAMILRTNNAHIYTLKRYLPFECLISKMSQQNLHKCRRGWLGL